MNCFGIVARRMEHWDLYEGKVVRVYNSTVHRMIGLSPSAYVLIFERMIRPNLRLGERERELWKHGNEKFQAFGVGERVLKKRVVIGRLNEIKFRISMKVCMKLSKFGRMS